MKAEIELKCSRCGKTFTMSEYKDTEEECRSWEKWAKETYSLGAYCDECRHIKSLETMKMKRGDGFATGWW